MGGFGSGRWTRYGSRTPVDVCYALDVNWLHGLQKGVKGPLRPGTIVTSSWTTIRGGDVRHTASVSIAATENGIRLSYTITDGEGSQDYDYPVRIVWVPCNYGGTRPYFVCPGIVNNVPCNRTVAKLYFPPRGRFFLCRHCYNLTYYSCNESGDWLARAAARRRQEGRKLGAEDRWDILQLSDDARPKGMHAKTFKRLHRAALAAVDEEQRAYLDDLHQFSVRLQENVSAHARSS
jgi:hypothetical protein